MSPHAQSGFKRHAPRPQQEAAPQHSAVLSLHVAPSSETSPSSEGVSYERTDVLHTLTACQQLLATCGEQLAHLEQVLRDFGQDGSPSHPSVAAWGGPRLSTREGEVLRLAERGATNKEIAERLCIAEGTVKRHMSNILEKLEAHDRREATLRARARGLI